MATVVSGTRLAEAWAAVRRRRPLVHHLTNLVTVGHVADVTLSCGARPVMAQALEEVEEVAAQAAALVLNLGTPTRERLAVMLAAGRAANRRGVPVVLDPVGCGATRFRRAAAARLLEAVRVRVVRGNRAEIATLAGLGATMVGVEAGETPADPLEAARRLAHQTAAVVAATGAHDVVSDGTQAWTVVHGHPLLTRITGGGDMATAVVAAVAAVEPDAVVATLAGLVAFGLAAEAAASAARGPGSFRPALLDALAALEPERVRDGAAVRAVAGVAGRG